MGIASSWKWRGTREVHWPKKNGGDVIALFPLIPGRHDGECQSYMRVGQHGPASFNIMRCTKPAHGGEPDVDALKRELESAPYHYQLRVLKRLPNRSTIQAWCKSTGL